MVASILDHIPAQSCLLSTTITASKPVVLIIIPCSSLLSISPTLTGLALGSLSSIINLDAVDVQIFVQSGEKLAAHSAAFTITSLDLQLLLSSLSNFLASASAVVPLGPPIPLNFLTAVTTSS